MSNVKSSIEMRCQEGSSDKVYRATVEEVTGGFVVNFAYGRYGSALTSGTKTAKPVTLEKAQAVFNKLVDEKRGKSYKVVGEVGSIPTVNEKVDTGLRPQLLNMIAEEDAETYIQDDDWGCQEKYDGKHLILKRHKSGAFTAANKKGQEIPPPVGAANELSGEAGPWVIDSELIGDKLWAFDLLESGSGDQRCEDYFTRYTNLGINFDAYSGSEAFSVVKLITGTKAKRAFVAKMKKEGREGVVFKKLSAKFSEGRPASGGNMLKLKFWSSCSCVVKSLTSNKRSIQVYLGDEYMGNVTIPPNYDLPSPGQIVEVKYLYVVGQGGALYQPIYLGVRDDVDASECTIKKQQIKYKAVED